MIPKIKIQILPETDIGEVILDALKINCVYRQSLIYAGINAKDAEEIMEKGSLEHSIAGWDNMNGSVQYINQYLKRRLRPSTPDNYIFAGTESDILNFIDSTKDKAAVKEYIIDPVAIALRYKIPAVAVYDGKQFKPGAKIGPPHLIESLKLFKDPKNKLDSLVAIILFSYELPRGDRRFFEKTLGRKYPERREERMAA